MLRHSGNALKRFNEATEGKKLIQTVAEGRWMDGLAGGLGGTWAVPAAMRSRDGVVRGEEE